MKIYSLIRLYSLLFLIYPLTHSALQADGQIHIFMGTCRNITHNITADLNIAFVIVDENTGKIRGMTDIIGLSGSGVFIGEYNGQYIQFKTIAPESGITIEWKGKIENGMIHGSYDVQEQTLTDGTRIDPQKGIWTVSHKRNLSPPSQQKNLI